MNNNSNNNETTSSTPESQFMSERKLKRLFLTMDKEDMGYIELVRLQYLKSKVYNKPKVSTIAQPTTATSSSSSSDTSSEDLDSIDRKATNQDTNRDAVADSKRITKNRHIRQYLVEDLINYCEENKLDRVTYQQFCQFIRKKERALWDLFCEFGADKNGRLGKREIQAALTKAGVVVSDDELRAFIFHVDSDKDGIIKFGEWSEFLLFSPKKNFTIRHIYSFYLNIIHQSDTGDQILIPETSSRPPVVTFKYLIAGGIAGAISRTVTAPLDRIRVLLICKTSTDAAATLTAGVPSNNLSVFGNLRHFVGTMRDIMRVIYADGGLSAFWRGNGVNIIKIIPESAIRFYVFESCKRLLKSSRLREERNQATATSQSGTTPTEKGSLVIHASNFTTAERMIAGGAAGFASQFVIYPLETIKTRMMANLTQTTITSSMNEHTSAIRTAATMFKQDGFRAFFRGLGPSLLGIIPYASIDLTAYETLKQTYYQISGDRKPSTAVHLVCGATAGALSATVVYPLGLIRTRLQAQGTSTHQQRYPGGAIDVIRTTYRKESLRGFYKGLSPSLLKVIPAVSISYICYEEAKQRLQIS